MPDDPSQIEQHQGRRFAQAADDMRLLAIRQTLLVFEPPTEDISQDYATLLRRLRMVIDQELQRLTGALTPPKG